MSRNDSVGELKEKGSSVGGCSDDQGLISNASSFSLEMKTCLET